MSPVGTAVRFSPCVGGQVRTWSDDGVSRLWSVGDGGWLQATQATGCLSRAPWAAGRSAEAATLLDDGPALVLQPRLPVRTAAGLTMEQQVVRLGEPKRPSRSTFEDFRELITRAVESTAERFEFLVVERGGRDGSGEPFCLFAVLPAGAEHVAVVETAPAPSGSDLWGPYIDGANPTQTISAPASPETIAVAPTLMIEAIDGWGLDPWDLVLTFGQR